MTSFLLDDSIWEDFVYSVAIVRTACRRRADDFIRMTLRIGRAETDDNPESKQWVWYRLSLHAIWYAAVSTDQSRVNSHWAP